MNNSEEQARSRIAELREILEKANEDYYQKAKPTLSDRQYDALMQELLDLELEFGLQTPDSPSVRIGGKPTKTFPSVVHPVPLLSLSNAYSVGEILDFDRRISDILGHRDFHYHVEPKFDGMALRLRYEQGQLVLGATRGNGSKGDDITANVKTIGAIPLRLRPPFPQVVEVRGEAFMHRDDFAALNTQRQEDGLDAYANPRNFTAGSLKLQNPKEVAQRPISFFTYDMLDQENSDLTQFEKIIQLEQLGFPVHKDHFLASSIDEVVGLLERLEKKRHAYPFDTDGVVIKINEDRFREELGQTSKAPRWAIAYKFEAEQAETTLKSITLQVGRLGTITPVAELEPVQLAGTTVKRATLHNEDEIHRKDIRLGDRVVIEKAGEIIPQVVSVTSTKNANRKDAFRMPKNCPACQTPLIKYDGEVAWRCENIACPPQVKFRITHFASRNAMDIEGLGEAVVEQLVENKLITDYADLYSLTGDELLNLDRFAEKSATNLIRAISKSVEQPFEKVLFALGIRFVGETVAKDLARHYRHVDALMAAEESELLEVDSIGPKIAGSVRHFFSEKETLDRLEKLKKAGLQFQMEKANPTSERLKKQIVVLTGTLPTLSRKQVATLIEQHGGKVTHSVSKNTTFVLVGDSAGSKLEKAKSLNIPVLSEEEFFKRIGR